MLEDRVRVLVREGGRDRVCEFTLLLIFICAVQMAASLACYEHRKWVKSGELWRCFMIQVCLMANSPEIIWQAQLSMSLEEPEIWDFKCSYSLRLFFKTTRDSFSSPSTYLCWLFSHSFIINTQTGTGRPNTHSYSEMKRINLATSRVTYSKQTRKLWSHFHLTDKRKKIFYSQSNLFYFF